MTYIRNYYNKNYAKPKKKYSNEYDQRLRKSLKEITIKINDVVDNAVKELSFENQKTGRPLKDRTLLTKLYLFQNLFNFTNREMECFSSIFLFSQKEIYSYKTIERAFSDSRVRVIIHKVFELSIGEKRNLNISGDGTGYSLTISKHYRTDRINDLKNNKETSERKEYICNFALVDIDTNLYVGYSSGFKSEKELFKKTILQTKHIGITISELMLDKYFSYPEIFDHVDKDTKVYMIPKSNATINGCHRWKKMLNYFVKQPFEHLSKYYRREKSEANYSSDKRKFGIIRQRLKERIINCSFARAVLHNFRMSSLYA